MIGYVAASERGSHCQRGTRGIGSGSELPWDLPRGCSISLCPRIPQESQPAISQHTWHLQLLQAVFADLLINDTLPEKWTLLHFTKAGAFWGNPNLEVLCDTRLERSQFQDKIWRGPVQRRDLYHDRWSQRHIWDRTRILLDEGFVSQLDRKDFPRSQVPANPHPPHLRIRHFWSNSERWG